MAERKNDEQTIAEKPKKTTFKPALIKLLLLAAVAAAGYGMWKNPQIIGQVKNAFTSEKKDVYQPQIDALQQQLRMAQAQIQQLAATVSEPDLSAVHEKMDAIEKMNLNVIDSKADVATVLGVITRMDKAEQKLDRMASISDESALTLTALMLVKDSAERGGSFEYEAEVLSEVVKGNPKLQEKAVRIESFAKEGIANTRELEKSFNEIYQGLLKQQKQDFDKTWKERINSKLQEIVQIKKVNAEAPEFQADQGLEKVKSAVDKGDLVLAVRELEMPQNATLLENENLKQWLEQVKNREEFQDLISSMSASSLAIMKVRFLKKTEQN